MARFNRNDDAVQLDDYNIGSFLDDRSVFGNSLPVVTIDGHTASMLRCIDTFRDNAFPSNDGFGIGLHILRFLVQKTHNHRP